MRILSLLSCMLLLGTAPASAAQLSLFIDQDGMLRPRLPAAADNPATSAAPIERRPSGESAAVSTHKGPAAVQADAFAQSLQASVETDPGMQASAARGRAAGAAVWREWATLLPVIEAGVIYSNEASGRYKYATVSASMSLLDPAAYSRIRSASSQAMAASSEVGAERDRQLIATAAAWLRGAYALRAVEEYRGSVVQLEKLRKSVKARQSSGFSSAADVNSVDARIASLKRELATLAEISSKAEVEIDTLTGGRVSLSRALPADSAITAYGDEQLIEMAVMRNPTLQSAVHASNAALYDSKAARLDYMPKLKMSGDYNSAGAFGSAPANDGTTLGVRFTVPVFQPGYIANVAQKRELADAAYWQARDIERNVILQIRTLLRERDAATEKRRQVAREMEELEKVVASLSARYREGFATIDELLNQQVALARVKAQAVEVRTQQLYTVFQIMVMAGLADQQGS